MYPTLYHAIYDLFGLEISALKIVNSFGFFVAMAFLVAAALLRREMDRKQSLGLFQSTTQKIRVGEPVSGMEIAGQGLLGFLFGWKFLYLIFNAAELFASGMPQEHLFSGKGSVLLGLIMGGGLAGLRWRQSRSSQLDKPRTESIELPASQHVGGIITAAAIGGIVGAKLFHLLEYPDELVRFFTDPSLSNFLGGLTIYGGLLMGGLAVFLYGRKYGLKFLHLADATAPGLMLGYGIGRIGCQVSGDGDWGIPNPNPQPTWLQWLPEWTWSYAYPNNVNGVYGPRSAGYTGKLIEPTDPWPIFEGYGTYLDPAVFPTAFYETVLATLIFALLWSLRKRIQIPGQLFALYLIFNGFERFWIEKIRVNAIMEMAGIEFTQAELIATLTFLAGAFLWFWFPRRNHHQANSH